jgi:hypothetical protein
MNCVTGFVRDIKIKLSKLVGGGDFANNLWMLTVGKLEVFAGII